MPAVGGVDLATQFYFATVIKGSARVILGKEDEPRGIQEKE